MLAGRDPYVTVHSAQLPWGPYLFYPVPAFLIAMPLAWLPAQLAGAAFAGSGAALLAFVLWPLERWRLWLLASAPMLIAGGSCQWSPLLVATVLYPPAFGLVAAKPTFALPLIAMQRDWRFLKPAVLGGLVLLVGSFVLLPGWLPEWIDASRLAARAGGYSIPALTPLGAICSLAVLRWRRPEARLLLAMVWMPQKLLFYDQLPLLLIPKTKRELMSVVAISLVALALTLDRPWASADAMARLGPAVLIGLYWPALFLVLAGRMTGGQIKTAAKSR